MDSSQTRWPCFRDEDDDGLASVADMEAGFSGNNHPFFSRSSMGFSRRSSLRNLSSVSPRSGRVFDSRFEEHRQPHFLENCFLCKKSLSGNSDIFMYRGDTPFCSEDCRQEQIDNDEAKEKKWRLSSSMKLRKKEQNRTATSPNKSQNYPVRTGTVVAA